MSTPVMLSPVMLSEVQTNNLLLSSKFQDTFKNKIVAMNDLIFHVQFQQDINPQQVHFSTKTKYLTYQMNELPDLCKLFNFQSNPQHFIRIFQIELYYNSKMNESRKKFSKPWLSKSFINMFCGAYINNNQTIAFKAGLFQFEATIRIIEPQRKFGFIQNTTVIKFKPAPHQNFILVEYDQNQENENNGASQQNNNSEEKQIDFREKLLKTRAGGLGSQIQYIYRRIFTSRKFSGLQWERIGLRHSKGMILYGPPGTGKTLLARQLSSVLDVKPTIINGPQIMDKYVGEGERKLREIFKPAIEEYNKKGSQSSLHVIIFDEIDSIAKRRGSSDSTNADTLVNQLLTLIDGVESPNNILVIGMTNRLDLIDEALLRPGRLQVHVEVFLPTLQGRKQIFDIHLRDMKSYGIVDTDLDTYQLARSAKNYTGAEIQCLIKSSFSFAVKEYESQKKLKALKDLRINKKHFELAKMDIVTQFGQDEKQINSLIPNYQINVGKFEPSIEKLIRGWIKKCQNIQQGKLTLLIKGVPRTGKTALAAKCSKMIDLPFTKWVSCDKIYSLTQNQRINYLVKVLEDSKRCSESCIVLDSLLRLIQYVNLGQKYNNNLLQLVKNIVQSSSQKGKKKVIIATCDSINVLDDLGISRIFSDVVQVGVLKKEQAFQALQQHQVCLSDIMVDQNQESYTIGELSEIIQQTKRKSMR